MGLSWLAAKTIIKQAYKTAGHNGLLSLSDLSYHAANSIEHDGSLSRLDGCIEQQSTRQIQSRTFR